MQRIEQAIGENEVTITAETRGYEAEGHNGTWHTVDEKEYAGEKFFLMEHDEFGSDVQELLYRKMVSLLQKICGMGLMQER